MWMKHMRCFSNNMHSTLAEWLSDPFAAYNLSKTSKRPTQRVTRMLSTRACGVMSRVHGANSFMNEIWRICGFLSKPLIKLFMQTHVSPVWQLSTICIFEGCPCGPYMLINWVHDCLHDWLQPQSFAPQDGIAQACPTGLLSRTAPRSIVTRLLPPSAMPMPLADTLSKLQKRRDKVVSHNLQHGVPAESKTEEKSTPLGWPVVNRPPLCMFPSTRKISRARRHAHTLPVQPPSLKPLQQTSTTDNPTEDMKHQPDPRKLTHRYPPDARVAQRNSRIRRVMMLEVARSSDSLLNHMD